MTINGSPFQSSRYYTLVTKDFLYNGKDGYSSFANSELLSDGEENPSLDTLIINFFQLMTKRNLKWFSTRKYRVEKGNSRNFIYTKF